MLALCCSQKHPWRVEVEGDWQGWFRYATERAREIFGNAYEHAFNTGVLFLRCSPAALRFSLAWHEVMRCVRPALPRLCFSTPCQDQRGLPLASSLCQDKDAGHMFLQSDWHAPALAPELVMHGFPNTGVRLHLSTCCYEHEQDQGKEPEHESSVG